MTLKEDDHCHYPNHQSERELVKDPFTLWGESITQSLEQKGFTPGRLVSPVVQFTRELSVFPDVSALSLCAKSFAVRPMLEMTLFIANETLTRADRGVLPTFYLKSDELNLSLMNEWDILWELADAVHSSRPDDINSDLANRGDMLDGTKEGWIFIGGIWLRNTQLVKNQLPLVSEE